MNMYDAAVVDMVDAMYEYRRVGAHCMRYVEFVRNPTAGSLALYFCSSVFGCLILEWPSMKDMPMDQMSNDISTRRNYMNDVTTTSDLLSYDLILLLGRKKLQFQ